MYCVSLYKMTAINLMCPELPIGVDNFAAIPTAVHEGRAEGLACADLGAAPGL